VSRSAALTLDEFLNSTRFGVVKRDHTYEDGEARKPDRWPQMYRCKNSSLVSSTNGQVGDVT